MKTMMVIVVVGAATQMVVTMWVVTAMWVVMMMVGAATQMVVTIIYLPICACLPCIPHLTHLISLTRRAMAAKPLQMTLLQTLTSTQLMIWYLKG